MASDANVLHYSAGATDCIGEYYTPDTAAGPLPVVLVVHAWDGLNDETRKLIEANVAKVEDEMWEAVKQADKMGMACNANGPCTLGEPGGMVAVEPSEADKAQLADIVENFVVKRWAKRCGSDCAKEWNETMGKVVGVTAPL